jgi:LmbE family N-acetylglucosaminyl deacetylase
MPLQPDIEGVTRTMERILVIAAHPDDEVLGCGGAIARHCAAGESVRVVFLAEGITARHDPVEFDRPDVQKAVERRNENAIRAMAVLGIGPENVFTSDRYCCRLDQVPLIDLVKEIEGHLHDFNPTTLFTHALHDPNVDHGLAQQAVLAAVRPTKKSALRTIYAFEVLSATEWNPSQPFQANAFYDIEDFMDAKVEALLAYEDEVLPPPHPRSEVVLRALATYRGTQVGCRYAEAFQLIRSLK